MLTCRDRDLHRKMPFVTCSHFVIPSRIPPSRNGSGERFYQRFQGKANSHTNHLGKFIGKLSRGFSVSRTRLQWRMHQASPVWVGVVCLDFLGNFWEILEPVAKSWESSAGNSGIFASSDGSQVHQSRPKKRRDLCHVTQLRACSRTGHKGSDRESGDHEPRPAKDSCMSIIF